MKHVKFLGPQENANLSLLKLLNSKLLLNVIIIYMFNVLVTLRLAISYLLCSIFITNPKSLQAETLCADRIPLVETSTP